MSRQSNQKCRIEPGHGNIDKLDKRLKIDIPKQAPHALIYGLIELIFKAKHYLPIARAAAFLTAVAAAFALSTAFR